ncbi:MAG: hypothetical protein CM15mP49_14100 [Actinomycetota bacterium]|nr:MAG: hypothetical protein CM15mP49_14100 [Actinomycetota bacterium]
MKDSGLSSCYIRPIAYYGYGEMGLATSNCTVDVAIACWPWGAYLGDDAATKVSDENIVMGSPRSQHYAARLENYWQLRKLNACKMEALNAGYDEAIMLNKEGLVAECSGENLFVCRNGKIMTPPLVSGALEGITQHTVMSFVRIWVTK